MRMSRQSTDATITSSPSTRNGCMLVPWKWSVRLSEESDNCSSFAITRSCSPGMEARGPSDGLFATQHELLELAEASQARRLVAALRSRRLAVAPLLRSAAIRRRRVHDQRLLRYRDEKGVDVGEKRVGRDAVT